MWKFKKKNKPTVGNFIRHFAHSTSDLQKANWFCEYRVTDLGSSTCIAITTVVVVLIYFSFDFYFAILKGRSMDEYCDEL